MGFDDYSYKFYNNAVLNPKTIKQINEQEDTFYVGGGSGVEIGKEEGGGIAINDQESILTQENIREFENSIVHDEDGMDNFRGKNNNQIDNVTPTMLVEGDKTKKPGKENEEEEKHSDQEEGDEDNQKEMIEQRPKITIEQVEELKDLQE